MNQMVLPRKTTAAVPLSAPPVVEVVGLDWLAARAEAWDRLVEEAAYPNPFFSRHVLAAHLDRGLGGKAPVRFVVVRRGDTLLALLPFTARGTRVGLWQRAHAGWTSPYAVNGTPLVAAGNTATAIEAFLDAWPTVVGTSYWLLQQISLDDPVAVAIAAAAERRGWAVAALSSFERAVLDRRADYEAYAAAHLGAGRRKAMRRQHSRLAALGGLEMRSIAAGEDLGGVVEAFLNLEAQGWKGQRGTALLSRSDTAAMARRLFDAKTGPVTARADGLYLDGRPIALSLALVCGGTAHLLKTAYDETLRKHGPGVLLENEIVRVFHDTGFARRLDSASLPGGVLDDLYPDRERIGDLLIACNPKVTQAKLCALADEDRRLRDRLARLKAVYWQMRDLKAADLRGWLARPPAPADKS